MRWLNGRVSLSTKYAGLVVGAVLLPTGVYLLLDVFFLRDALLRFQVDALIRTAKVVAAQLDPEDPDFSSKVRDVLHHHAIFHADLDVLVINQDASVLAATQQHRRGTRWQEEGIQEVLAGAPSAWTVMRHDGADVLDVTVPVTDRSGNVVWAIHMARSLRAVEAETQDITWRHGLFFSVTALLAIIILSVGTYWLVIRRLRKLDAALRTPHAARELPGPVGHEDEIDTLAVVIAGLVDDLNTSAEELQQSLVEKDVVLERSLGFNERLEEEVSKVRHELTAAQQRLIHAEHLSTIGQLAAGLAHEVRNPLFIIRGYAARLRKHSGEQKEVCDDIIAEVDRVNCIIKRLLEIGQPIDLDFQQVNIRDLLEKVVHKARQGLDQNRQIRMHLQCEDGIVVRADPHLLRQALANIVDNALHAVGSEGNITVAAMAESQRVLVSIRDDGSGIESKDLDHIFDPFFSRSPGGTGLGLCAAAKVLDLHDAETAVESQPGKGTTVQVALPAWPGE
jgi:signal transduction histidine kinase